MLLSLALASSQAESPSERLTVIRLTIVALPSLNLDGLQGDLVFVPRLPQKQSFGAIVLEGEVGRIHHQAIWHAVETVKNLEQHDGVAKVWQIS